MLFTGAGGLDKKVKKTSARMCSRLEEEEAEKYEQEIHEAEAAELDAADCFAYCWLCGAQAELHSREAHLCGA